MRVCPNCHSEVSDNENCSNCGYVFPIVKEYTFNQQDIVRFLSKKGLRNSFYKECMREIDMTNIEKEYKIWMNYSLLSLFIPAMGFVYYFQFLNTKRAHAKNYLLCGIWGIVFYVLIIVGIITLINI